MTGANDPSRLAVFLQVVDELVGEASDTSEMPGLAKDAMVDDMRMTRAQVQKLLSFVKDVEAAIEARPAKIERAASSSDDESGIFFVGKPLEEPTDQGGVLIYGGMAMDIISEVDQFPRPNSTLEALNCRTSPGGKGANAMVACGNLETQVYAVGRLGADDFGRTLLDRLRSYSCVDTSNITVVPDAGTGFALIVTSNVAKKKTNTICKGVNASIEEEDYLRLAKVMTDHVDIRIMLLTLDAGDRENSAMSKVAQMGQEAKKLVILRASPLDEKRGLTQPLWDNSNIVILTTTEAAIALHNGDEEFKPIRSLQKCATTASALLKRSDTLVAVIIASGMGVTCRLNLSRMRCLMNPPINPSGSEKLAAEIEDGDEYTITLPPFRGPVVDVVGAVDALTGAIAAALARGVPLSHALVWGSVCSCKSISQHGAQESMPSMHELQGFFRMEKVHVLVDGDVDEGHRWTVAKPIVGVDLRNLEELLHAGKHAAFRDALSELQKRLEAGEGPERFVTVISLPIDFQGQTLLHLAVVYCDIQSVLALLSAGANGSLRDNYGKTPLQRCHIEFTAAQDNARDKFALIKFCLACHDQVNRLLHGTEPELQSSSNPSADPECDAEGGPAARGKSASMPAVGEANTTPLVLELSDLYDCGRVLTPLLKHGWAYSVLSLMTLPMDESLDCEKYKSEVHALSNNLTLQVLRDVTVRDVAIATMTQTMLSTGTKFSHGLAYSGSDEVMRALQGSAVVESAADPCAGDTVEEPQVRGAVSQYVKECMYDSRDTTDADGRSLLHYAMIGENLSMCVTLLNWGHNLFAKDAQGKIPRAYCKDPSFVERVKLLRLETDAFVSVGHTDATDRVISLLVDEAKKEKLHLWWDKGGVAEGPGIRPGEPWTAEIDRAMQKCKLCVVVLTKKWLSSVYCRGEVKCALAYNKEILALLPPLPEEERAKLEDVPADMHADLTRRQVFDFSMCSDESFKTELPAVFDIIESIKPTFSQNEGYEKDDVLENRKTCISEVIMPSVVGVRWSADKHVFVLGATSAEDETTQFTRLLANELVASGVPVVLGFKPSDTNRGEDYASLLQQSIDKCTFLVIVVQEASDFDFLSSVAQLSSSAKGKVVIVPYTQISRREQDGGFGYTAHLTDPISCCFTDWVGNGVGLKDANHPLFKDCFRDFLVKLDDLQGNDEDVSRHGSSLELSRPPPVQFGFSITRSSSDLKGVDEAQPEAK